MKLNAVFICICSNGEDYEKPRYPLMVLTVSCTTHHSDRAGSHELRLCSPPLRGEAEGTPVA
ncbi:hypothetical protein QJS04_geneDACA007888 [Acorus gramineus]|uniref:Uncharacterized protein n=1 Tax=Acorus gramineus TaxID=55184 RepID=A0AAV9B916_ACOGR|nr:hypothetical protein QJS04_geneDACA007888 [Acorus gramineus]